MTFPTLYYFIDLRLGTAYLKAVRDLGYTQETMKVIPTNRADLYSMRSFKDPDVWIDVHIGDKQPEEQVRIVQAGMHTSSYVSPPKIYCIGIVENLDTIDVEAFNSFGELWVPHKGLLESLRFQKVRCPIEIVNPDTVAKVFDPLSLV